MKNILVHTMIPIHIDGGENTIYSPYIDYIIRKEDKKYYICYLNKDAIISKFDDKMIEKYVQNLRNFNNRSTMTLKEFLVKNNIKIEEKNIIEKLFYKNYGDTNQKLEIKGFIKSPRGRYIPGSSVKGAIKTAVLYSYIKRDKKIKNKLYTNLINIKNVKPKFVFTNYFIKNYFECLKNKPPCDPFQYIQISDSDIIPTKNFFVGEIKILHTKKGEGGSPLRWEFLNGGIDILMKFKFRKPIKLKFKEDPFWNFIEEKNYYKLFEFINEFSTDFITRELDYLKDRRVVDDIEGNVMDNMREGYIKIQELIRKSKNKKAYMPLGMGIGFFSKSIDNVFTPYEFNNIREVFRKNRKPPRSLGIIKGKFSEIFPVTRHVNLTTQKKLLGWVRLELEG